MFGFSLIKTAKYEKYLEELAMLEKKNVDLLKLRNELDDDILDLRNQNTAMRLANNKHIKDLDSLRKDYKKLQKKIIDFGRKNVMFDDFFSVVDCKSTCEECSLKQKNCKRIACGSKEVCIIPKYFQHKK